MAEQAVQVKRSFSMDKAGADDQPKAQFRASRSAAELATDAEGYADPGLAEHKDGAGKHLGPHWHAGRGGLRQEDAEDEQERLAELEQGKGVVSRAKEAVMGAAVSVAATVAPGLFKQSPSAAELAYGEGEGYADPGLAEHKSPSGKHLEGHWHKGYGGLRAEGADADDEEQRLRELREHDRATSKGVVQRAKETVSATASVATEKAGEVLEAAKEMVGLGSEK